MGAQSIDKILEDLGYVDIPESAQGKSRKTGNNRLVKSDRGKPKVCSWPSRVIPRNATQNATKGGSISLSLKPKPTRPKA